MDLDLGTRTALITGSYRGTGAGIARSLAAEGASVLVHELESGQAEAVVGKYGPVEGERTSSPEILEATRAQTLF